MGVAANRAGAAQGRGAEGGGEAAVGRAAGRLARDLETEPGGRAAIGFKKLLALFVLLERQKITLAHDAALAALHLAAGADVAHLAEDLLHDVEGWKAHVDRRSGAR